MASDNGDGQGERRAVDRKIIAYFARVFDIKSNELLGNLGDITSQGIMLIGEVPIPVNSVFNVKLELSEDVAEKNFMEIEIESIWCQPDISPNRYNTGFRITAIDPDDREIIEQIVAEYGIRR